jgi:[protein-PII] uridylyltransferase
MAEELGAQLGLGEHERHLLVFLVHKHLLMAHTAFRRDLADLDTLLQFARGVSTAEALRMLCVLTAADTEAVAPGSWTGWKEQLLTELYSRAMEELTGEAPVADEKARSDGIRRSLEEKLRGAFPPEWLSGQLAAMPFSYLRATPPETVAAHLRVLRALAPSSVRVESEYLREAGLTQYAVFLRDDLTPGIFSKISGVLAAERFQIVGARIVTRSDGVVIDTFRGMDVDFRGEPPAGRCAAVARRIEDVLLGKATLDGLFPGRGAARRPSGRSTQVEIDTATSDRFSIIEVFADDRQGLLYVITRTLFELGLSVSSARISTRLDQVVDAFYVTDRGGAKVTYEARLEEIRRRLVEVIDSF